MMSETQISPSYIRVVPTRSSPNLSRAPASPGSEKLWTTATMCARLASRQPDGLCQGETFVSNWPRDDSNGNCGIMVVKTCGVSFKMMDVDVQQAGRMW